MSSYKRFIPLYATNIFGVMNDNFLKVLVCFIAVTWNIPEEWKPVVINATGGALVLPYLFFSPLAGKLPKYFRKVSIVQAAKIAEIFIMTVAMTGFFLQNIWITIAAVLMMGLQSALFSPAKYGLIKEIGGKDGISRGMGGMEAIAFLGMMAGTVIASFLAENTDPSDYYYDYGVMIILAAAGIACSFLIKVDECKENITTSANPTIFLRDTSRLISKYKGLKHVIHLLSLFWWLAASVQMILIIYCADKLNLSSSETGYLLVICAIGITAGCLIGGALDQKTEYMLGYVPLFGVITGLLCILVFAVDLPAIPFAIVIGLIAICGGIFKIPLDAEIQKRVDSSELNVVLAYFNLISFVYIFIASATNILITSVMGLSSEYVFLTLGVVLGVCSIMFIFNYKSVLCYFGRQHIRTHYRITTIGRENLETQEGQNMLILPMHRAVIDPIMLFAELYDKKMQPLVDEGYFKIPGIGHVLSLFDAIEVPDLRVSRKGVEKVRQLDDIIAKGMNDGSNILFYPSGHITTDGKETIGTRHLAYNAALALPEHTKVVAIRMKGLWGSQWSRYGLKKTPSIVKLLLKSAVLIFSTAILFMKKREITIEYIDITEKVRQWCDGTTKVEFNTRLEEFYNENTDGEKPTLI